MSAIFISHSSADSEAARQLSARLRDQGHRSVFLDFDPEDGIPAGRDWERDLYQQLRACRAVIVLCSEHSMASKWCFAEITHAKSLGKHLFPVRIGECDLSPLLTWAQVIDLSSDPDGGYERLWQGLLKAGLDPKDAFNWDERRPLYPGLLAFQEADAAIYFGREDEIRDGLSELNRLWQMGGDQGLVILGPSGTGKSSLVRAGLLPRLRRDSDRWLTVEPFRPGRRPWQSLAMALSDTFTAHGQSRDWKALREELEAGAGSTLVEACLELTHVAGRRESRVLFIVDQMEELLGADGGGSPFLPGFAQALSEGPLMFLGTLRSDFLGELQNDPGAQDLNYRDLRIGPLARDRIGQVIEGPAALKGLELEAGLTQAMVEDCERGDALPLLAFALRVLNERYGDDGVWELDDYRALGGLQGAVARAADDAFEDVPEKVARAAFLSMVRVNDEGVATRRLTRWSDLPEDAIPMMERFVEARLLMSGERDGERIVEVAHEALIRYWERLKRWVNEDRELLLWRQRLSHYIREWKAAARDPTTLLSGPILEEAERWVAERGEDVDTSERAFVADSVAERRRGRQHVAAYSGAALLLVLGIGWGVSAFQQARNDRAAFELIATGERLPEGWLDALDDDADTLELSNAQFAELAYALEDMVARGQATPRRTRRARALRENVRAEFIAVRGAPPDEAEDTLLNRRVRIDGRTFLMGAEEGYPFAVPIREVTVSTFRIQQHEVTNEEYRRFDPGHDRFRSGREQHPVTMVTWLDAMAYAVWLGGTLPTEAQWELAARGAAGRLYPWEGDEEPTCARAHYGDGQRIAVEVGLPTQFLTTRDFCEPESTVPVMSRPEGATPEGVHDLAGNVYELMSNWFGGGYDPADVSDPRGPSTGSARVTRGGSWDDAIQRLRNTSRYYLQPNAGDQSHGFRVAWPGGQ